MQSLLSIEWLKIKKYRTFWIITCCFIFLLAFWNFGISGGLLQMGPTNILGGTKTFADIWPSLGFYASHFVIFISILIIILTTNENQFRTNRQNIIDGWNRLQFYHAKWMLVIVFSILITVVVFIVGLLIGLQEDAYLPNITDNLQKVYLTFLLSLNYLGFALTISVFFKRSGIAIGIFLLYYMIVETIIHLIFFFKYKWYWGDLLLPLQSSDELLRSPSMEKMINFAAMATGTAQTKMGLDTYLYVIATCCWIIIYYLLGRRQLMKSDW